MDEIPALAVETFSAILDAYHLTRMTPTPQLHEELLRWMFLAGL